MAAPSKFQFSLANLFLMTLCIALVLALVSYSFREREAGFALTGLIFGVPCAVGSLIAGLKGMRLGFMAAFGMVFVLYLLFGLLIIVMLFMSIVAGYFR
jgi:hypothetical protein